MKIQKFEDIQAWQKSRAEKVERTGADIWHYHLTLYELVILLVYIEENLEFIER